jgi:hypothetical protein
MEIITDIDKLHQTGSYKIALVCIYADKTFWFKACIVVITWNCNVLKIVKIFDVFALVINLQAFSTLA